MIKCPHCGFIHGYSEDVYLLDFEGDEYRAECEGCGREYIIRRVVSVTYQTEEES